MTDKIPEAGKPTQAAEPLALRLNDQLGTEERAKLDALLGHIYEHGTTAEGVMSLAVQLCLTARKVERRRVDSLYNELLFAVGNKHPGETRHQTALRYIQQAEAVQAGGAPQCEVSNAALTGRPREEA